VVVVVAVVAVVAAVAVEVLLGWSQAITSEFPPGKG